MSDPLPSLDEPNDLQLTAADAENLRAEANALRAAAVGATGGDPMWRTITLARAVALEDVATKVTTPGPGRPPLERGAGGEVRLRENSDDPWPRREVARATRATPDLLDAEASQERLGLAREAGALTLALDAAEGMGAASPAEQMVAHQMATAHALAMRLAAKADAFAARKFLTYHPRGATAEDEAKREQVASIEAARMATASARLMEATTRAALTLDRLRNGNRQTVVVQYVTVADGGQAVVAGAMGPGAGGNERGSPGTAGLCGLSGNPSAADSGGRCRSPLRRPPAARRAAVLRAGHAERPLPQARRRQHGPALGGGDGPVAASAAEARRAQRRGAPSGPRPRRGPEGAGGAERTAARPVTARHLSFRKHRTMHGPMTAEPATRAQNILRCRHKTVVDVAMT